MWTGVRQLSFSHLVVSDSAAPWTAARQAPLCMGFSRQEYWSGLPLPSPGGLPDPGIEPASLASPALQADSLPLAPPATVCDLNSIHRTNWQQRPYDPHFRDEATEREVVFSRSQGR